MRTFSLLLSHGMVLLIGLGLGVYYGLPSFSIPKQPVLLLLHATSRQGLTLGDRATLRIPSSGTLSWESDGDEIELRFPRASRPKAEVRLPLVGMRDGSVEEIKINSDRVKIDIEDLPDPEFPLSR